MGLGKVLDFLIANALDDTGRFQRIEQEKVVVRSIFVGNYFDDFLAENSS